MLAGHPVRLLVRVDQGRDVEKRLVEGNRLNQVSQSQEHLVQLPRDLTVHVKARREEDGLRAESACGAAGHRRVDAKATRFVAGRRYHASGCWIATDDDRLAAQLRPVPLLDRAVEGIEVDMDDGPHQRLRCTAAI